MEKNRAIPKGYMTVGELAKKLNVTVRTLQYYDKEGFLSPGAESEGGRRLYTDKDLIYLHQILSLKHLGFSLKEIKNKLMPMDTPQDIERALSEQARDIEIKIESLTKTHKEIELLKAEVLQMQTVNFKKYADIIANLQMENEKYWLIKHMDEQALDHVRNRYDMQGAKDFMDKFNAVNEEILSLQKNNMPPESEAAQALAKKFWDLIMDITQGDMNILPRLIEMGEIKTSSTKTEQTQIIVNDYIGKALDVYFTKTGVDTYMEGKK